MLQWMRTDTTEIVRKALEQTQRFSDKVKELTNKFRIQRENIKAQTEKEIQEVVRKQSQAIDQRRAFDRRLLQVRDLLKTE